MKNQRTSPSEVSSIGANPQDRGGLGQPLYLCGGQGPTQAKVTEGSEPM